MIDQLDWIVHLGAGVPHHRCAVLRMGQPW
jgi:hypothetical protein